MIKIDNLIDSILGEDNLYFPEQHFSSENIKKIMKEYAEYYAKKCLEIAINEINCGNAEDFQYDIARKSILNIKLPEHE